MSERLRLKKVKLRRRQMEGKQLGTMTPSEIKALDNIIKDKDIDEFDLDVDNADEVLKEVVSDLNSKKKQKENEESSKSADRFGGYWTRDKEGKLKYIKIPGKESYEQWKSRLGVKKKKLKLKPEK
jgi:hypothetical protein